MTRKTFVSAGWPYLYEIPGLHNCIPMLFADSVARYRRLLGEKVTFVTGADEHGSRVEFVSEGLGTSPQALVDAKVAATMPLLAELGMSFDVWGRTSDPRHKQFVASFVDRLLERGAIERREVPVAFCPTCDRHIPDRFTQGACPHCGGPAFGNQCNDKRKCGVLLEPSELKDGHCAVCGGAFEMRAREHLFLPFAEYSDALLRHIETSYAEAPAIRERALAGLAGSQGAALTRDGSWGVPLPNRAALPDRTVYSWVDSLLGKVSFADPASREGALWREPGVEKLFFLGADGVSFYGVLFPALLMAAGDGYDIGAWRIVTNDVLIYEGGVCSKSGRNGISLPEALSLLPGDLWRFVIFEAEARAALSGSTEGAADLDFRWDSFAAAANRDLARIEAVYAPLEGRQPEPELGAAELRVVRDALDALRPGWAFGLLLRLLHGDVRPTLAAGALPLLSCFLPETAKKAEAVLAGGHLPPLFPGLPLDGAALRSKYLSLVAERRAGVDLAAEIAEARGEFLLVCPTRLGER